jgi:hypothetical protein
LDGLIVNESSKVNCVANQQFMPGITYFNDLGFSTVPARPSLIPATSKIFVA